MEPGKSKRIFTQEESERWDRLRQRAEEYAVKTTNRSRTVEPQDKLSSEHEINKVLHERHLKGVFFIGDYPGPTGGLSLWFGDCQVDIIAVPVDFNGETIQEALESATKMVFSVLPLGE